MDRLPGRPGDLVRFLDWHPRPHVGGEVALDLDTGEALGGRLLPGPPGGLQPLNETIVALVNADNGSALLTIDTGAARSA